MSATARLINRVGTAEPVRHALTTTPAVAALAQRFVGGPSAETAVAATARLRQRGVLATLHVRRGPVTDEAGATAHVTEYRRLIGLLERTGLAVGSEVSVKLEQCGLRTPGGRDTALANLRRIADSARAAGVLVTLDTEAWDEVDVTLDIARSLRAAHPLLGVVLQAYLRRTETDVAEFAGPESRVRLCKGGYRLDPAIVDTSGHRVAHLTTHDIDRAYARCLNTLMAGHGRPLLATHDARLIRIATHLAARHGRTPGSYEFQFLQGVRPALARDLTSQGEAVRLYVAYGPEWYGWLVRRISERPRNLALVAPLGGRT